ncbi:MAG: hypothetical protein KBD76_11690 [Bacteriovorax sp.]|nr:hypothetical protein [Bacteriovorax sp.]
MKQITNISLLVMVLSIPFALSQTRKAIPAGRYEALSGVKVSHVAKGTEVAVGKDSISLFWGEVLKHIPQGSNQKFYFKSGKLETDFKALLNSAGIQEAQSMNHKVNLFLSDDLKRDAELFKNFKTKGNLLLLKEKEGLKEVLNALRLYDMLVYQNETDANYYLLKRK